MNNVSITEKYALCMLKEKRSFYESELTPHLFVSMVVEMMLDENLEITNKNKVKLNEKLPATNYNKELYKIIKEMKKEEVPFKDIVTSICYGFTSKKMKSIIERLKEKMIEDNLIILETKKGLFGNKEIITINEDKFTNTVEEIKSEFLEKGKLTDEIILLSSLLNSTKFLKNIFTKYEKETLNNRLKEMKNTEIAEKVKVAQSVIGDMSAIAMTVIMMSTMN